MSAPLAQMIAEDVFTPPTDATQAAVRRHVRHSNPVIQGWLLRGYVTAAELEQLAMEATRTAGILQSTAGLCERYGTREAVLQDAALLFDLGTWADQMSDAVDDMLFRRGNSLWRCPLQAELCS